MTMLELAAGICCGMVAGVTSLAVIGLALWVGVNAIRHRLIYGTWFPAMEE